MSLNGTIWGSFSGVSTAVARPYISWSATQSSAGNYSDVTAIVKYIKYNASWGSYNNSHSVTETINGNVSTGSYAFDLRPVGTAPITVTVRSRTVRVYHNANGTKSCAISFSSITNTSLGNGSASTSVTLTAIIRATAVTSTAASSVGGTVATTGGTVTDAGLPPCSSRGVYWGTAVGSQPNKLVSGSGSGAFNVNISGLSRGTKYYFKAYSYNTSYGYKYGSVLNFTTTSAAPNVTTGASSAIDTTIATVAGNVTDDNGASVTTRGICYNTGGSPTTASDKVADGSGEGAFSSDLTGLDPDTTYYAKAYATNSVDTSYGAQVDFDTLVAIPTVTTTVGATGITTVVATVAGSVTSDNGATITERGFVYGLTINPTTANSKATTTGTTGAMSKEITGLGACVDYHFRAYAINSEGTGYGTDSTFTTLPTNPISLTATVQDKDEILLEWASNIDAKYIIIKEQEDSPPANINSGATTWNETRATANSYTAPGLSAGTHMYYRLWTASTADWSDAYSAGYVSADETTIKAFTNPNNALTDDVNYATIPTNDGKLYAKISKDDGVTWSIAKELTFTGSITTQSFGLSTTELWGDSWVGSDLDDGSFAVKIIGGSSESSYQIYKTFGFTITDAAVLTGVRVQVKAAFDSTNLLLYFVKANGHYGTSDLPIGEGSLAYDSTKDEPTYYNGAEWLSISPNATNLASTIVGVADKATPVDADTIPLVDSADSNKLKELTWANLKVTIKSYYDSVASTITNKTLSNSVMSGTVTLEENSSIVLDPVLSADGKYTGMTRTGTAGATLAFGDLVYLDPTDSRWELVDANIAAGANGDPRGMVGVCVQVAAANGSATTILLWGTVRADAVFPTFTVNAPVYISESIGNVVVTQPTTTDVVIRVLGFGLTANEMFFCPSTDYITHT